MGLVLLDSKYYFGQVNPSISIAYFRLYLNHVGGSTLEVL